MASEFYFFMIIFASSLASPLPLPQTNDDLNNKVLDLIREYALNSSNGEDSVEILTGKFGLSAQQAADLQSVDLTFTRIFGITPEEARILRYASLRVHCPECVTINYIIVPLRNASYDDLSDKVLKLIREYVLNSSNGTVNITINSTSEEDSRSIKVLTETFEIFTELAAEDGDLSVKIFELIREYASNSRNVSIGVETSTGSTQIVETIVGNFNITNVLREVDDEEYTLARFIPYDLYFIVAVYPSILCRLQPDIQTVIKFLLYLNYNIRM